MTHQLLYWAQSTSKIEFQVCTLLRVRKISEHGMAQFPSESKTPASSKHSYCQPPFVIQHGQKRHRRAETALPRPARRTLFASNPDAKLSCLIRPSFGSSNWPNKLHYQTHTYTQITILLSQVQTIVSSPSSGTGACLCTRSDAGEHCAGQEQRKTWEWLRNNRNKTQKTFFLP